MCASLTGASVDVGGTTTVSQLFAANMNDWDPKVTNGFAAEREVILFDNMVLLERQARRRRQ